MEEKLPEHIYPVIKCVREENTLVLSTTLRKKHRGKYYYWNFERRAYVPKDKNDFTAAISSFNRDIYIAQLHGKIDIKASYKDGTKFYQLCNDQMSEVDRMNPDRRFGVSAEQEKKSRTKK